MADQPSKESLERARIWLHHACGDGECLNQKAETCLALEFDAIAANAKEKESCRLAVETNRIVQTRLADLRQQNAALVSALRDVREIIHFNTNCYMCHKCKKSAIYAAEKIEETVAIYAPAEAEAKEKP